MNIINKKCFFSELPILENKNYNSSVFYEPGSKSLSVEVVDGMNFSIPIGHPIVNVFPLSEGVLIQTESIKLISKEYLKNELFNNIIEEEQESTFCLFSLNCHPLSQLFPVRSLNSSLKRESIGHDFKLSASKLKNTSDIFLDSYEKIIHSFLELPLIITYDLKNKIYKFYSVTINMKVLKEMSETISLNGSISLIEQKNPQFLQKLKSSKSMIHLKPIYQYREPNSDFLNCFLLQNIFQKISNCCKEYSIYLKIKENNIFKIIIFKLMISIEENRANQIFHKIEINKIDEISNVNKILTHNYFDSQRIKCLKSMFFAPINPLCLDETFNCKKTDISTQSKKELFLSDFITRKCLNDIFNSYSLSDSILIQKSDKSILLMMENQQIGYHKAFAPTNIFSIQNNDMINYFPKLNSDFCLSIFFICREVFDNETFWNIFKDLINNFCFYEENPFFVHQQHSKIKSQFHLFGSNCDELVISYFCFLLLHKHLNISQLLK